MATKWASLPASWSNKKKSERLNPAAYSSLTRMLSRAVADTGTNFSIWSALRTHADQVKLFKENYTPAGRGRKLSTDRSYQGKIWKRKPGGVSVASPDLGSNHQDGNAVDIHPGAIQNWIKKHGLLYGWSWDEGRRVGEDWHFRYIASRDQMKSEGRLDHAWVQRVVGAGVDGKIGTGTVAKIKAWQKKHGLTADGKVGPKTKKAMQGKGDATPAPAEGGSSAPSGTTGTAVDGIYPWADSTSQWFEDAYSGQSYKGGGNKGLLHSTEGSGWPGYGGGSSAPHLTVRFDTNAETVAARQHFKSTRPSRALVNKSGGVQTNNQDVFQIELVGTCDRELAKKGVPYLPDLLTEPWAQSGLAGILAAVSKDRDIPLTSTVTWAAYPGSYGVKAKQRLTGTAWTDYAGWLGHQHAPENDHGDPGDLPAAAILTAARGGAAPPDTSSTPDAGAGSGSSSKLPTGKDLLMALLAAPDFPLLRTTAHRCYYGPKSGPKESVSGHTANSLNPDDVGSSGSEGLKDWQGQMNSRGYSLVVDGKFGDKTEAAAKNLQRLAGLTQDGKIGPDTFYAAWLLPVVD